MFKSTFAVGEKLKNADLDLCICTMEQFCNKYICIALHNACRKKLKSMHLTQFELK